ncbi:hypothetical protein [Roseibium sediminicola]|uniref:Uncharacterized protein n=1 Tax=Roseibium sediminicola TaxID=2933272 RepID=A0ABT0GSG4_9HYPH|nr:hypothetical protein [Roseibium sp. CAU 1639]MCK7612012.1 hypothetical protein [Roseibium sp. CAU 1639]
MCWVFAIIFSLAGAAQAQDLSGKISLELNQLQPIEGGGCRMSIIATNGLDRPMDQLTLEMVAFDKNGLVDQFLGLKFSRISAGKTKILQFALAGKACDSLSRLHVNNVTNCVPPSITDVYCPDLLDLSNRTPIQFGD